MNVSLKRSAAMLGVGIVMSCGALGAQQPGHSKDVPRIRYIGLRPLSESAASRELITALKQGLGDLGYVESRDYLLEIRGLVSYAYRSAEMFRAAAT